MEALEKAAQLKSELDSLRPLDKEAEARIMQKFRLDWNYHSNNIEGNSLTYGETKVFILFGITAGRKPFKDYLEIKGHNEAINWVVDLVKGETELTEVFIRQLHELLLKESSESFAQTPDGKPTKKKIEVGKYKTLPNHVLTATGEMFYFATPENTPIEMQELIDWFRAERKKSDVNPIILAALFHYRFIRIHPFDDGNGRTARILMNFILMQNGYPPVIIKTEDKENYYGVLHLADVGELNPFIEYIANNLINSLEIMIRGAKGEDIEEADDLDKELALLEHKLKNQIKNSDNEKTQENLIKLFDNSIAPLFLELNRISKKFDRFYHESQPLISIDSSGFSSNEENKIITRMKDRLNTFNNIIKLQRSHLHLKTGDNINYESWIMIKLEANKFIVKNSENQIIFEKRYSNQLENEEIMGLVDFESKKHKEFIEKKLKSTP